jgi:hypothetical protein
VSRSARYELVRRRVDGDDLRRGKSGLPGQRIAELAPETWDVVAVQDDESETRIGCDGDRRRIGKEGNRGHRGVTGGVDDIHLRRTAWPVDRIGGRMATGRHGAVRRSKGPRDLHCDGEERQRKPDEASPCAHGSAILGLGWKARRSVRGPPAKPAPKGEGICTEGQPRPNPGACRRDERTERARRHCPLSPG